MSLNDHLKETQVSSEFTLENLGLTQDPLNSDGVLSMTPPGAPTAVIQTDMKTPGPHTTTLDDAEIAQIPDWNTQICVMTDTADKLVDMVAVQKDIEDGQGMSAERSHVIEATFENFYSARHPKNSFSQQDTKIGFGYASSFMKTRIQATMEELAVQFRAVQSDGLAQMADQALKARDYCVDELRDIINSAVGKIEAIAPIASAGPVILPFDGGVFKDMLKEDLSKIDLDQITHGVPLTAEFRESFAKLLALWNTAVVKQGVIQLAMACPDNKYDPADGLTASLLIQVFGDEVYRKIYQESLKISDQSVQELRTQMHTIGDRIAQGGVNYELISDKGQRMKDLAATVAGLEGQAVQFGEFATASADVLVYLVSLR